MLNLKVHEKLSKSQRLMQGRRYRVLKEIDQEIEQEVRGRFSSPSASPSICSSAISRQREPSGVDA